MSKPEQRTPGEILEEMDAGMAALRMELILLTFGLAFCVWLVFQLSANLKEIGYTEGIINGSLEADIRAEAYEQGYSAGRRSKEPEAAPERSRKAAGESTEAS